MSEIRALQGPLHTRRKTLAFLSSPLLLLAACGGPAETATAGGEVATVADSSKTALERYVAEPDPAYSWRVETTIDGDGYTASVLEMTSQSWLTEGEVDRPIWKHWLTIVRPDELKSDVGLLFIGGGDNDDPAPTDVDPTVLQPALATGTVTAELRMVPNQPLTFVGDDFGPRVEDELIAYGWDRFLRGGDDLWLARLPMTKSAVRALDTITAFTGSVEGGESPVERFVVAGGSKRGWTTWTTAVVDQRVIGIVPIVIDLLNVEASFEHHWKAYGFWAPAVGDYEREGIMDWMGTPEYARLQDIVEPFEYRDRLDLPKYLLNATGDQFFLPDSSQFYFDQLVGDKHLRYVPNSEHSMGGTDVAVGFLAFYQALVTGADHPEMTWSVDGGTIRVATRNEHEPSEVLLWQAYNPESRDFRVDTIGRTWTSTPLEEASDGEWVASVSEPTEGWRAFFVELTFPGPGEAPFKFSTEVQVVPEELPFEWPPAQPTQSATESGG